MESVLQLGGLKFIYIESSYVRAGTVWGFSWTNKNRSYGAVCLCVCVCEQMAQVMSKTLCRWCWGGATDRLTDGRQKNRELTQTRTLSNRKVIK